MVCFMDDNEKVLRERNDLEMMRRPQLWPGTIFHPEARLGGPLTNPALALKKYALMEGIEVRRMEFAVLIWRAGARDYCFVPDGKTEAEGRKGGDELLVALVEEGWLVD